MPEREKHCCKTAYRVALETHMRVFPVPEANFFVRVFVGYVDAARKRGLAVDNGYFSVIAQVKAGGKKGDEPVENFNFRACRFKSFYLAPARLERTAHAVGNNAHFRAPAYGGFKRGKKA